MIKDIIDEIKSLIPFKKERKYLPEELDNEPIELKSRVAFKLTVLLSTYAAICSIPVWYEEIFNDGKYTPAAILASIVMFGLFTPCFLARLYNKTKKLSISKYGIKLFGSSDTEFKWQEIHSIKHYINALPRTPYHSEGLILILKKRNQNDQKFSLCFYDSPLHIIEMLQKYSRKYDPSQKEFANNDIKEQYKKEKKHNRYASYIRLILIPVVIIVVYILSK